jgi:hypothetical protein
MSTSLSIKGPEDLLGVAPKDPAAFKGVPLASLIAYALYWIHEWELRATFEAVTVLSWRLFPSAFSLIGFPQFPDAARTTRSILQGQPKYRNILTGTPTRGFHLNELGEEIALEITKRIGVPENVQGAELGTVQERRRAADSSSDRRSVDIRSQIEHARKSRLFKRWQQSNISEKDVIDVHSMLGIFDHTPSKERQRIYKDLLDSAQQTGDMETVRFLESIREMFPNVFANRQRQ